MPKNPYLQNIGRESLKDFDETLRNVLSELRMCLSITGSTSRVADLWPQWMKVKEKYKLYEEFATQAGKKLFRKEMPLPMKIGTILRHTQLSKLSRRITLKKCGLIFCP